MIPHQPALQLCLPLAHMKTFELFVHHKPPTSYLQPINRSRAVQAVFHLVLQHQPPAAHPTIFTEQPILRAHIPTIHLACRCHRSVCHRILKLQYNHHLPTRSCRPTKQTFGIHRLIHITPNSTCCWHHLINPHSLVSTMLAYHLMPKLAT